MPSWTCEKSFNLIFVSFIHFDRICCSIKHRKHDIILALNRKANSISKSCPKYLPFHLLYLPFYLPSIFFCLLVIFLSIFVIISYHWYFSFTHLLFTFYLRVYLPEKPTHHVLIFTRGVSPSL